MSVHRRTNTMTSIKSPALSTDLTYAVEAHVDKILNRGMNQSMPTSLQKEEDERIAALKLDGGKPGPEFAATIDHTLLKPDAKPEQIKKICEEAVKFGFKSCCVNAVHIKQVTKYFERDLTATSLPNPPVACAVVGFPLGANTTAVKAFEANTAVADGAGEVDMVISIGHLKARDYAHVLQDISAVVAAAGSGVLVKVIIETALLTDEEKVAACYIAAEAGAKFVKTCTGFNGGGATAEDIKLMRRAVEHKEGKVKVKASAGIRTFEQCAAMLKAGAHRIGASAGVAIMENKEGTGY